MWWMDIGFKLSIAVAKFHEAGLLYNNFSFEHIMMRTPYDPVLVDLGNVFKEHTNKESLLYIAGTTEKNYLIKLL